jgi:hypothetical protein
MSKKKGKRVGTLGTTKHNQLEITRHSVLSAMRLIPFKAKHFNKWSKLKKFTESLEPLEEMRLIKAYRA